MFWFQNIYTFFSSIFEILTFRTKPEFNVIYDNNNYVDGANTAYDEYEFIMLNET
jgi:hypothetical protein